MAFGGNAEVDKEKGKRKFTYFHFLNTLLFLSSTQGSEKEVRIQRLGGPDNAETSRSHEGFCLFPNSSGKLYKNVLSSTVPISKTLEATKRSIHWKIEKLWHIHKMECCKGIKTDLPQLHATVWMNLSNVSLNEKSKSQKITQRIIHFS